MSDRMALKIAVDLLHVPSQVRLVRSEPLPDGVLTLLRIAAADEEAAQTAAALMDRSVEVMGKAAMFFIEQILFAPDADSYRVLGTGPQATSSELRRNVALLMRWLHPDLDRRGERSVFTGRVTTAWNNVKTPERRAAYDELLARHAQTARKSNGKSKKSRRRRSDAGKLAGNGEMPRNRPSGRRGGGMAKTGFLRRALAALFVRPSR
jgi:hypothetical protein